MHLVGIKWNTYDWAGLVGKQIKFVHIKQRLTNARAAKAFRTWNALCLQSRAKSTGLVLMANALSHVSHRSTRRGFNSWRQTVSEGRLEQLQLQHSEALGQAKRDHQLDAQAKVDQMQSMTDKIKMAASAHLSHTLLRMTAFAVTKAMRKWTAWCANQRSHQEQGLRRAQMMGQVIRQYRDRARAMGFHAWAYRTKAHRLQEDQIRWDEVRVKAAIDAGILGMDAAVQQATKRSSFRACSRWKAWTAVTDRQRHVLRGCLRRSSSRTLATGLRSWRTHVEEERRREERATFGRRYPPNWRIVFLKLKSRKTAQ